MAGAGNAATPAARHVPLTAVIGAALLLANGLIEVLVYVGFGIPFGYPGILFLLNAAASALLAAAVLAGRRVASHLGALLCAATILGFVLARTTGLPGLQFSDWVVMLAFLPLGPLSLLVEGLYLGLYAGTLPRRPRTARR